MNCWEFKKCGEETMQACPAYPDRGNDCWKITGTYCESGKLRMKTRTEKIEHCRNCDFYVEYANKF